MKKNLSIVCLFVLLFGCQNDFEPKDSASLDQFQFRSFETIIEFEDFIENPESEFNTSLDRDITKVIGEDRLMKIGQNYIKFDLENDFVLLTKDEEKVSSLMEGNTNEPDIEIYSTFDDLLTLIENGSNGTIARIEEVKEYNSKMLKKFSAIEGSSKGNLEERAFQSTFTFPPSPLNGPYYIINAERPFSDINFFCSFIPKWGIIGISSSTNTTNRYIDYIQSSSCNQAAYYDLIYIRAAVYFELKVQLTYIRNNGSFNNSSLYVFNDFYYERRRRFQSNEKVRSSNEASGTNQSQIERFIYSGSRGLETFWVESYFTYNNMPDCCSTSITSRRINIPRLVGNF